MCAGGSCTTPKGRRAVEMFPIECVGRGEMGDMEVLYQLIHMRCHHTIVRSYETMGHAIDP